MENDLLHWWFFRDPAEKTLADGVEIFRGPTKGVKQLHADDHIHRDFNLRNAFKKKRVLSAVLGDFGKSCHAKTHTFKHLGPVGLQAPEINGTTHYTNKIDIYSLGMAMLEMLFVAVFHNPYYGYNPNAAQDWEWYQKTCTYLDSHLLLSSLHMDICTLLKDMVHPDPVRRPTAANLVRRWPKYQPLSPAQKRLSGADAPSAKRVKVNVQTGT